MTKRFVLAAVAVAATGVGLVPASAAGGTSPQFQTQQVYFHCAGTTRLGNASVAEGSIPSWNTTAPTGSATSGTAGCASADPALPVAINPEENPTDGVWTGSFVGNLDQLTVVLYNAGVGTARSDGAGALGIRLKIDGVPYTGDDTTAYEMQAVDSNSGATQTYTFSVTHLGLVEPNDDVDGDGVGDNPFGSERHTITLNVDSYYPDTNTVSNWVFDTSEVPAGIVFNPTSLAPFVIDAGGDEEAA